MRFYIVFKNDKIALCETEKEAITEYFKDEHFYGENKMDGFFDRNGRGKDMPGNVFKKRNFN